MPGYGWSPPLTARSLVSVSNLKAGMYFEVVHSSARRASMLRSACNIPSPTTHSRLGLHFLGVPSWYSTLDK